MPLVTPPTTPATPASDPVTTTAPAFKGVAQDTRYTPAKNIVSFVEGYRWTVDYFSAVLGSDSMQTGQNLGLSAVTQQYRFIEKLEVKVSTPLSSNQNIETKEFHTTGAAHVFPGLVPTEGDVFIGQIADGRFGLFEVTSSERKSVFKDSVHYIEYTMVDYLTDERRNDLMSKIVIHYVYTANQLRYNLSPLIERKEYNTLEEMANIYESMIHLYMRRFFNKDLLTMLLPGQATPTYDHFLTCAIRTLVQTTQAPEMLRYRVLNFDEDLLLQADTLWTAIYEGSPDYLINAVKKVGIVSMAAFGKDRPETRAAYYTGVCAVVYPTDYLMSEGWLNKGIYKDQEATSMPASLPARTDLPTDMPPADTTVTPPAAGELDTDTVDYYPVHQDNYYVFSSNFYNYSATNTAIKMSRLEMLTWQMINQQSVDPATLLRLVKSYHRWGTMEIFYYTPILMALIRYVCKIV